ncbi:MAG: hypothetical protein V7K48_21530 [Nostoc sp.]
MKWSKASLYFVGIRRFSVRVGGASDREASRRETHRWRSLS